MLDYEPVSSHQAQGVVSGKPDRAPHDGADHTRVKQLEIDNPFVTLVSRRS